MSKEKNKLQKEKIKQMTDKQLRFALASGYKNEDYKNLLMEYSKRINKRG